MPPSRAFFIALPLGLLVAVGGFFGLFWLQLGYGGAGSRAMIEIIERKEAAAESEAGPRILIVGGSATMFGVLAARIESATGIPTFNLGSHAGLGGKYILDRAEPLLRPGDTVLLILEYELYDQGDENMADWANAVFIDFLIAGDSAYFRSLPLREQLGLAIRQSFRKIRKGLKARFNPQPTTHHEVVYDVANVDDHGDLMHHHRSDKPATMLVDYRNDAFGLGITNTNTAGWPIISRFIVGAEAKGVRVLAAFPNVPEDSRYAVPAYAEKLELIRRFYTDLGVPVLGTAQDAMLPPADFFDTVYHPVYEGSEQRTARLIQLLAPFVTAPMAKGPSPANRAASP